MAESFANTGARSWWSNAVCRDNWSMIRNQNGVGSCPLSIAHGRPNRRGRCVLRGYLAGFIKTNDPLEAAFHGSVSASLKVEGTGPFYAWMYCLAWQRRDSVRSDNWREQCRRDNMIIFKIDYLRLQFRSSRSRRRHWRRDRAASLCADVSFRKV